jgi:phospholipid-binding lipoprotein MlaA
MVSGCSTTVQPVAEPLRPVSEYVKPDVQHAIQVSDPLEGVNRRIYRFNYYFDTYLFLPVVNAYRFVMPDYAENRVSDFLDNVLEISNLTNCILQIKPKETGITIGRILINSTVGIFGLWDPATQMGLARQDEDFGQTLGYYGIGNGPYLVLPIFGPSNLRDAIGSGADVFAFITIDPLNFDNNEEWMQSTFNALYAIDKRKRTPFRYYASGSPFEYDLVRLLYTEKRFLQIKK